MILNLEGFYGAVIIKHIKMSTNVINYENRQFCMKSTGGLVHMHKRS